MAFCINCGQALSEEAKFCVACGTATMQSNTTTQRKIVFEGSIHKCPSCGEVVSTFLTNCPACGFEFNSKTVNSSLANFIDEINECDRLIANTPMTNKKGWASWSKTKRILWVILNLFTFGIPLIIYLYVKVISTVISLARYDSTPKLTPHEKRKASLIENFPFPNERESILEALLFVKAKISFLASEKVNQKNAYWTRLWSAKAEQLYQKAEIMFHGDRTANDAYKEIIVWKERVARTVKHKAVAYTIILIVAILAWGIRNGSFEDIVLGNSVLVIPETELSTLMPQIEEGKGEIAINNSSYFKVNYYSISVDEFEKYKLMCKDAGFIIDCESDGSLFDAFNEDGYNIQVRYYDKKMDVTVADKIDMRKIIWPDSKIASLLPIPKSDYGNLSSSSDTCVLVYIGNTTIDGFNEYVYACMEKGFDNDVSRSAFHFHADNDEGYGVIVEYRGYNTMFIRIDD
ncbi:MAG: zinc ribbon domain-containing protein [Lachnospiraceae bacterium]|nr:zinc ribbon domain-containing protein [Lachnospiraceae bacterium]